MTADDVALAARVVVAVVLTASGVGKLVGSRGRSGGDVGITSLVARALPMYELVLAALLLVVDAAWPSWLAVVTFAAFTVVLGRRIATGDRRPCNCFGAGSRRELSVGSLLRNAWFLALAVVATGATTLSEPSALFATIVVACGFLAVSAVLVART